jgi:hypothetical protein
VAALGVSGCSQPASEPTPSPAATGPAVAAPLPAGLPEPSELIDVLNRLTDPAVTGQDKLPLVEGSTPGDATDLDSFATALQDNRMLPLTFTATDLVWSPDLPGDVTANVTATPGDPGIGPFTFPMNFTAKTGAWQLSRQTADLLLALGVKEPTSSATATPPAPPSPTPTP